MNIKEYYKAKLMESLNEEEIKPEMPRVSWTDAIRGGLGGEGALKRLKGLYKKNISSGEYADRLYDLHDHLSDSGVDIEHPHMRTISNLAAEAKHEAYVEERDKSRSRGE